MPYSAQFRAICSYNLCNSYFFHLSSFRCKRLPILWTKVSPRSELFLLFKVIHCALMKEPLEGRKKNWTKMVEKWRIWDPNEGFLILRRTGVKRASSKIMCFPTCIEGFKWTLINSRLRTVKLLARREESASFSTSNELCPHVCFHFKCQVIWSGFSNSFALITHQFNLFIHQFIQNRSPHTIIIRGPRCPAVIGYAMTMSPWLLQYYARISHTAKIKNASHAGTCDDLRQTGNGFPSSCGFEDIPITFLTTEWVHIHFFQSTQSSISFLVYCVFFFLFIAFYFFWSCQLLFLYLPTTLSIKEAAKVLPPADIF